MSQGAANLKVELVTIDHLCDQEVQPLYFPFPDKHKLSKFSTWNEVVEKRVELHADDTDAEPSSKGKHGTGPVVIIRNAEELSLTPDEKKLAINDKGIVAQFCIVVTPIESRLKELAKCEQPLKVLIIQEMLDLYLVRHYKSESPDDPGFSVRTTLGTEDHKMPDDITIDCDKHHRSDTPAYCTKYCYKTCDVSELRKNKELSMTVFFYDSPIDAASFSQTWDAKTIAATNKALHKNIPHKAGDEMSLDYVEKFAPYRTWLAIYDPNCDFYYPQFCFEWVSQYRIDVKENRTFDPSTLCPKDSIPFLEKVDQRFLQTGSDSSDPRTLHPALVYPRANWESGPSLDEVITVWKTLPEKHKIANDSQHFPAYYGETLVMKEFYGDGPAVASDALGDEEERSGLKVVWQVREKMDDGKYV